MDNVISIIAASLHIVGLVLTGWGLVSAIIATQRDILSARDRIDDLASLRDQQRAESKALDAKYRSDREEALRSADRAEGERAAKRLDEENSIAGTALNMRYKELYRSKDLVYPQYDIMDQLALHESQWLLRRILDSNKVNAALVGGGLVVTTIASIISLFQ